MIKDRIEGFFTIARQGKPPPDIVLPLGEQNGKTGTVLAEVCTLRVPF